MGLETGQWIDDFTPTWPTATDKKQQGDDHLRLIKSILKTTFPRAGKAFYFPTVEPISGTLTLDITDMNNIVEVDTTAGNVTVNLPTLAAGDKGWRCEVIKVSNDANAAIVTPAAGTILSKVGSTATIRVGILCEPAVFMWSGSAWRCFKSGPMIGSTESFDGPSLPPGYLWNAGVSFSSTLFAELYLAMGSSATTTRDKRGRVEFGKDNMNSSDAGRLTSAIVGGIDGDTLAAVGGEQAHVLLEAALANHTHSIIGQTSGRSAAHTHSYTITVLGTLVAGGGGPNFGVSSLGTTGTGSDSVDHTHDLNFTSGSKGSNAAHNTVPPGIVVNKILRAC